MNRKLKPCKNWFLTHWCRFCWFLRLPACFLFFYFLDIFGIYGFYIFLMGGRKLLSLPREKRDNLILKIVAANWIVFGLISFTLAKLLITLD